MEVTLHRRIPNNFPSLHELMEEATRFLESNQVDERAVYMVNLAIEEVVTNIVKYGYDIPGNYLIDVTLNVSAEDVSVIICDDGHPFDPTVHERRPSALTIADREIGGLGILLIKKLLDRIEYRREAERNVLKLVARRGNSGPPLRINP